MLWVVCCDWRIKYRTECVCVGGRRGGTGYLDFGSVILLDENTPWNVHTKSYSYVSVSSVSSHFSNTRSLLLFSSVCWTFYTLQYSVLFFVYVPHFVCFFFLPILALPFHIRTIFPYPHLHLCHTRNETKFHFLFVRVFHSLSCVFRDWDSIGYINAMACSLVFTCEKQMIWRHNIFELFVFSCCSFSCFFRVSRRFIHVLSVMFSACVTKSASKCVCVCPSLSSMNCTKRATTRIFFK